MFNRGPPNWFWPLFGTKQSESGFPLGSACLLAVALFVWFIDADLCLNPELVLPPHMQVWRLLTYSFCHKGAPSLLCSAALLIVLSQRQERRWGTVRFLALSLLSATAPALIYALLVYLGVGSPGPVCGYSVAHFAMLSAHCRHARQRKILHRVPVPALPWLVLGLTSLLLPDSPALLHLCGVCVGTSYSSSFLGWLEKGEGLAVFRPLPHNFFIPSGTRDQLPLTSTDRRPQLTPEPSSASPPPAPAPFNRPHWPIYHTPPAPWQSAAFEWTAEGALAASESLLLEEELLRAGILASLQESPEESPDKLEVPKSSVSSLRLQQLERMGFPTEKAVVALAASGKLEGAISLLIDNRVGEEAVVTTRGKAVPSQRPV